MRTSYTRRGAAEIFRLCARAGAGIVVIATLGLCISTAMAQGPTVPKYDVKGYCKEIAGFGGTFSEMVMEGCLGMKQTSYNKLKERWGKIAQPIRIHCDEIARFGGRASYTTLEGCIEMETGAAKKNAVTEFKY